MIKTVDSPAIRRPAGHRRRAALVRRAPATGSRDAL